MSSTGSDASDGSGSPTESLALLRDARFTFALPASAAREEEHDLPAIDLSNLPGARVLARRGYANARVTLRVICAAAPASGWAPGIEEIILGRATQLARQALPGPTSAFVASEPVVAALGFDVGFEGTLAGEPGARSVRGRHWLGFAGQPREGVLCTVACVEPMLGTACAPLVAEAKPSGTWLDAPPPNLVARTLLLTAARPWEAAALLALVSLVASAIVVVRRPRPRPGG